MIEYKRGNIRILDEPGLEDACCGCYDIFLQGRAAGRETAS